MNKLETCVAVVLLGAVLGGCSSTPVKPPAVNSTSAKAPAAMEQPVSRGPSSSTVATVTVPPYLDPTNPISKERSVYFGFDDFSIRKDYVGLIQLQGDYLESKPSVSIKIEGNADERGSPEYNLALGQRRAEAVLKALEIYGVKDAQMEAISWGKERPKASGHDEAAWAQNRRADLVYPPQ
jgi:peptidoglycan-associated lipoprotein